MPPIVVHVHDDVRSANDVFVRAVSALSDAQLRAPSRLPNWTRGHVAAHVALNAEGFVEVASALRSGQRAFMYPSGLAERDQAIDDLALASSEELTARVRDAGLAFMEAWDPLPPIGDCATAPGYPTFSPSTVLQRRLRELQASDFHRLLAGDPQLRQAILDDITKRYPQAARRPAEATPAGPVPAPGPGAEPGPG